MIHKKLLEFNSFYHIYDKQQRLTYFYFLNTFYLIPYNVIFIYFLYDSLLLEIRKNKNFISNSLKTKLKTNFSNTLFYEITLQLIGIGQKVYLKKNYLYFFLGYSHIIKVLLPKNVNIKLSGNLSVTIKGKNYSEIKRLSYLIRNLRIPDNYKGKGINFKGNILNLKISKKSKN